MFREPISASVPGGDHLEEQQNCHDFNFKGSLIVNGSLFVYGFVLDGMGAGRHSEIGAKLGGQKLESLTIQNLRCSEFRISEDNYSEFPEFIYVEMLAWMKAFIQLQQPLDVAEFVKDYLMFSIAGFLIAPEITLVIRSDDGVVQLNDEVQTFSAKSPKYLGHHLVPEGTKFKRHDIPDHFITTAYYTRSINRILVATDGLTGKITEDIWGATTDGALYRKLVVLQRNGKLTDDGSVVMTRRNSDTVQDTNRR